MERVTDDALKSASDTVEKAKDMGREKLEKGYENARESYLSRVFIYKLSGLLRRNPC